MSKKTVDFVTHAENYPGSNPSLTATGCLDVRKIKELVLSPTHVYCGTGRRHEETRRELGLELVPTTWTPAIGGAESSAVVDDQELVILADGTPIPRKNYKPTIDFVTSMLVLLDQAPNHSVIISGRHNLMMLGVTDPRPATVYRISFKGKPTIHNVKIQEVKKTVDKGT